MNPGLTQIQHAARDFFIFNPLNPNTRTIAQCSGLIEPGLSLNSLGIGTLENQGDLPTKCVSPT